MSDLHTIAACYTPPDEDAPEIECTIYFTFLKGSPATGPTYSSGGEQACPAEVEFGHVEPSTPDIEAWARDYLQGEGYDDACEQAAEDMQPDPDEAYERMRDERMERRNYE